MKLHTQVKPPPSGYKTVVNGTTNSGDLVWNKDEQKWEPVDSVNEYVDEYIAVCRPKYQQALTFRATIKEP